MDFLFSDSIFFIFRKPASKNGMQMIPHATQNLAGKYPSIICMAFAVGAIAKPAINIVIRPMILFCFLFINIPLFYKKSFFGSFHS